VNVYTLATAWAADIGQDTFDGNDGNDRTAGSGLQVGACPAVASSCVVPSTGCQTGACRTLCDLYVGTPRALLAGAMTRVVRATDTVNKTGLKLADALAVAAATTRHDGLRCRNRWLVIARDVVASTTDPSRVEVAQQQNAATPDDRRRTLPDDGLAFAGVADRGDQGRERAEQHDGSNQEAWRVPGFQRTSAAGMMKVSDTSPQAAVADAVTTGRSTRVAA
jgi:hypothetical protein